MKQDMHWFLDSVPTKDLGLTKNGIKKSKESHYVIGGVCGDLENIINVHESLGLTKKSKGKRLISMRSLKRNPENLSLINGVLNNFIDSRKISIFGTVFYHSQIPTIVRENPELFVSPDNPNEVGIRGMRGRAFAQTVWIFMEGYVKERHDINPIVCLDNEDPVIKQSVRYHFDNQMAELRPNSTVKVQSEDRASTGEPTGYRVSDIICSILGNYIKFPAEFGTFNELINKTIKFDTRLRVLAPDGYSKFETVAVPHWNI